MCPGEPRGRDHGVGIRADAKTVAAGLPDARLTLLTEQRHCRVHRAAELFASTVLDCRGHQQHPAAVRRR